MSIKTVSGHILEIGDKVKMNIDAIRARNDMDGIEFSSSGKNYWKYMNAHPDEVYTVTALDFSQDECIYVLSGFMGDNTWAADELILLPAPESFFEVIKNMTLEEMSENLLSMVLALCEDGVPSPSFVKEWLESRPSESLNP